MSSLCARTAPRTFSLTERASRRSLSLLRQAACPPTPGVAKDLCAYSDAERELMGEMLNSPMRAMGLHDCDDDDVASPQTLHRVDERGRGDEPDDDFDDGYGAAWDMPESLLTGGIPAGFQVRGRRRSPVRAPERSPLRETSSPVPCALDRPRTREALCGPSMRPRAEPRYARFVSPRRRPVALAPIDARSLSRRSHSPPPERSGRGTRARRS